jgi:hypothetical protein
MAAGRLLPSMTYEATRSLRWLDERGLCSHSWWTFPCTGDFRATANKALEGVADGLLPRLRPVLDELGAVSFAVGMFSVPVLFIVTEGSLEVTWLLHSPSWQLPVVNSSSAGCSSAGAAKPGP